MNRNLASINQLINYGTQQIVLIKFCLLALHFLMWRTKGKNGSFIAMRMRIRQIVLLP